MDAISQAIARCEELAGQDIQQRHIAPLVAHVRGNLAAAATSIARSPAPSVAIITGFYLSHGVPPNCETDGPPGAAVLAVGLASVGIPCRVVTDGFSADVLRATFAAADPAGTVTLDIVSSGDAPGTLDLVSTKALWDAATPPISHVISVERCGPSSDGRARDARGVDMTIHNAPMELLFSGPWTTIGIGDLGNEIGMGSLPFELVATHIRRGAELWCKVPCDYPIVAGISNWGAAALLAAVALMWPRPAHAILDALQPQFARRLLEAAVLEGRAVANMRGRPVPQPRLYVDGEPWAIVEGVHRQIHEICRDALLRSS